MDKKRIYLSLPISGCDIEECRRRAQEAEDRLSAGWDVFNPLKNGLPVDAGTHRHMRRDLATLTNEERPFSAIYMMRRWTHSKGCQTELSVATAIGLDVVFEELGDGCVKFE